eukprot:CAMPEP_0201601094 /NCGR_PEP_ID=MMETSP0492-20130828/2110_1 /ASSEMBLY_ACC=CAM_ASM_000837 /TAXON_ID=420259 /ORGANISM="Thalassiosira gravida, Strain GMp14c1" /LENGTH=133 /DNA_ID=CAMNT_0048064185 /DNA_START=241 /DNA_END=642 /DNA_ORIENTATION=+
MPLLDEALHHNAISPLRMMNNYKSPDEGNSYNDDAFGLVFLTGGVLTQDFDFIGTFAAFSALAAIATKLGVVEKDERLPAGVALLTLVVTPVVASLRVTGKLENMAPPMVIEVGLCTVSAIWAFVNYSQGEKS